MVTVSYNRNYYSQYPARDEWLIETIGTGNYGSHIREGMKWCSYEAFGHWQYRFVNEADAMLFILKWPGANDIIRD